MVVAWGLLGVAGCEPSYELPSLAAPPLAHEGLARCSVVATTTTLTAPGEPSVVPLEMWDYDRRGRRASVSYDDDGDGVFDRQHEDRWGEQAPRRTVSTEALDPDYRFEASYVYEATTLLAETVSVDQRGPGGSVVSSTVRVRYRYDLGLLVGIEEDIGADGRVDASASLTWASPTFHIERRDDRVTRRTLDEGRLATSLEQPTDDTLPATRVWMSWSSAEPERPLLRTVDVGDDGLVEGTTRWAYDCP